MYEDMILARSWDKKKFGKTLTEKKRVSEVCAWHGETNCFYCYYAKELKRMSLMKKNEKTGKYRRSGNTCCKTCSEKWRKAYQKVGVYKLMVTTYGTEVENHKFSNHEGSVATVSQEVYQH